MAETVERLAAVLLVSPDAGRLADFYRAVLGVPLEDEQHGDMELHYGCQLGDLHFAIHPVENFLAAPETGEGRVRLAFDVRDAEAMRAGSRSTAWTSSSAPAIWAGRKCWACATPMATSSNSCR